MYAASSSSPAGPCWDLWVCSVNQPGKWIPVKNTWFFFPVQFIPWMSSAEMFLLYMDHSLTCVPLWYHEQLQLQRLQCFHQEKCSWSNILFWLQRRHLTGACPCFIACEDGKGDWFVSKISQWVRSQSVSFLSSLTLQLLLSRVKRFSAKICPAIIIISFKTILGMLLSCWGTGRKCNHKYF